MSPSRRLAIALLAGAGLVACASDATRVEGDYYDSTWYDPWYYGPSVYGGDVIVTPPPRHERPPRPAHLPASPSRPSIPMAPRPMPRGGGRR